MDVPDRVTRLDVLTITAPPAAVGASSAPVADPKTPSFAESLQRPTRESSPPPKPKAKPDASAPEIEPKAGTGSSAGETAAGPTTSASVKTPAPAAAETAKPTVEDSESASAIDEAADETIQLLVAGLVTAAAAAPSAPTSAAPAAGPPVQTPPVSLIQALQAAAESTVPPVAVAESNASNPLPAIPSGLQAGLSQTGNLPQPVLPSAAALNKPTDDAGNPLGGAGDILDADVAPSATTQVTDASQNGAIPVNDSAGAPMDAVAPEVSSESLAGNGPAPNANVPAGTAPIPTAGRTVAASRAAETITPQGATPSAQSSDQRTAAAAGSQASATTLGDDAQSGDGSPLVTASRLTGQSPSDAASGRPQSGNSFPPTSAADQPPADHTMPAAGLSGLLDSSSTSAQGLSSVPSAASAGANAAAPSLVEQIHPVLHQAITQDRELSMTLRPPELGAVRIEVHHQDGRLSARLHTETASAQQLLTDQLPQLREALTQMGVAPDQVQVMRSEHLQSSSSSTAFADSQADARQSDNRQESQQQTPPEPQRVDEPEREELVRPAIRTRTALNLRI